MGTGPDRAQASRSRDRLVRIGCTEKETAGAEEFAPAAEAGNGFDEIRSMDTIVLVAARGNARNGEGPPLRARPMLHVRPRVNSAGWDFLKGSAALSSTALHR